MVFFREKIHKFMKNTKANLFQDPFMCIVAIVSLTILIGLIYVLYKNRHGLVGARNELRGMVTTFANRVNPFSSANKLKGAEIIGSKNSKNSKKTPETFKNVSRLQGAPLESSSNFTSAPEQNSNEHANVRTYVNSNVNAVPLNNSIRSVVKHGCNESKWGCCPDNRTSSKDYYGSNCWDYPMSSNNVPMNNQNNNPNSFGNVANVSNTVSNIASNAKVVNAVSNVVSNVKNSVKTPETFKKVNSMKELFDQKQSGWILSHTKVSPDCCPSTYTTSTGCICDDQLFVNTQFPTANRDPCAASFMKSNLLGLSAPTSYIDSESVMNSENTLAKSEPVPNQPMVESVFYKSEKMGQTY